MSPEDRELRFILKFIDESQGGVESLEEGFARVAEAADATTTRLGENATALTELEQRAAEVGDSLATQGMQEIDLLDPEAMSGFVKGLKDGIEEAGGELSESLSRNLESGLEEGAKAGLEGVQDRLRAIGGDDVLAELYDQTTELGRGYQVLQDRIENVSDSVVEMLRAEEDTDEAVAAQEAYRDAVEASQSALEDLIEKAQEFSQVPGGAVPLGPPDDPGDDVPGGATPFFEEAPARQVLAGVDPSNLLAEMRLRMEAARQSGSKFVNTIDKLPPAFMEATEQSKLLAAEQLRNLNHANLFRQALTGVAPQIDLSTKAGRALQQELNHVSNISGEIRERFSGVYNAAKRVVGLFGTFGVAIGFVKAIKDAAEFERTLRKVAAATREVSVGAGQELTAAFGAARAEIIQIGRTSSQGPIAVAKAVHQLTEDGLELNEALQATPGILTLASASGLELGRSVSISSKLLKAFNLDVSETSQIADVLTTAADATTASVESLVPGLLRTAPAARDAGLALGDAAAAVAVLSEKGPQGRAALGGLSRLLEALQRPSEKARQQLERMGLTVEDINPSVKGLAEVIDLLADKHVGHAKALNLVGPAAQRTLTELIKYSDRLNEVTEKTDNATGSAKKSAGIIGDTLLGAFSKLRSELEAITVEQSEFTQELNKGLQILTEYVRILAGSSDPNAKYAAQARGMAEGVEQLTDVLKLLAGAFILVRGAALAAGVAQAGVAGGWLAATAASGPLAGFVALLGAGAAAYAIFNSGASESELQMEAWEEQISDSKNTLDEFNNSATEAEKKIRAINVARKEEGLGKSVEEIRREIAVTEQMIDDVRQAAKGQGPLKDTFITDAPAKVQELRDKLDRLRVDLHEAQVLAKAFADSLAPSREAESRLKAVEGVTNDVAQSLVYLSGEQEKLYGSDAVAKINEFLTAKRRENASLQEELEATNKIFEAEQKLRALRQTAGPKDPRVAELQEQLEALRTPEEFAMRRTIDQQLESLGLGPELIRAASKSGADLVAVIQEKGQEAADAISSLGIENLTKEQRDSFIKQLETFKSLTPEVQDHVGSLLSLRAAVELVIKENLTLEEALKKVNDQRKEATRLEEQEEERRKDSQRRLLEQLKQKADAIARETLLNNVLYEQRESAAKALEIYDLAAQAGYKLSEERILGLFDAFEKVRARDEELNNRWIEGWRSAAEEFVYYAEDAAARGRQAFTDMVDDLKGALGDFLFEGEVDLKAFAERIGRRALDQTFDQLLGGVLRKVPGIIGGKPDTTSGEEAILKRMRNDVSNPIVEELHKIEQAIRDQTEAEQAQAVPPGIDPETGIWMRGGANTDEDTFDWDKYRRESLAAGEDIGTDTTTAQVEATEQQTAETVSALERLRTTVSETWAEATDDLLVGLDRLGGWFLSGIEGLAGLFAGGGAGDTISDLAKVVTTGKQVLGVVNVLSAQEGQENTSEPARTRVRVPARMFEHAKEWRDGGVTLGGGGIPAILHDNEAVVPLTSDHRIPMTAEGDVALPGGRSIPTDRVPRLAEGTENTSLFAKIRQSTYRRSALDSLPELASFRSLYAPPQLAGGIENTSTLGSIFSQLLDFFREGGPRPDGSPKGTGFLGTLPVRGGGVASEFSIGVPVLGKEMDVPTLMPTLTKQEVRILLDDVIPNNTRIPDSIAEKAIRHAELRAAQGKGPFFDPKTDRQYGGVLNFLSLMLEQQSEPVRPLQRDLAADRASTLRRTLDEQVRLEIEPFRAFMRGERLPDKFDSGGITIGNSGEIPAILHPNEGVVPLTENHGIPLAIRAGKLVVPLPGFDRHIPVDAPRFAQGGTTTTGQYNIDAAYFAGGYPTYQESFFNDLFNQQISGELAQGAVSDSGGFTTGGSGFASSLGTFAQLAGLFVTIVNFIRAFNQKKHDSFTSTTSEVSRYGLGTGVGIDTFDEGAVVTGPTLGLLAMNRKPEAVIPLSGGGVPVNLNLSGAAEPQDTRPIFLNTTVNVFARDLNSFRSAESQIAGVISASQRQALDRNH